MTRVRRRISDVTLSLTPMIDVMTVLLAVFMVTTPMMTNGIDLDLPNAGTTVLTGADHAMQISVDSAGRYFIGTDNLPLDAVIKRAVAMRGENSKLAIVINGDRRADYGAVMAVMGKLKSAGFERVGLRTKLDK